MRPIIPTFECKHALLKHTKPLNTLKLSKDARMLLSGADDGQLLVWDIIQGSLFQSISVVFNGPVSAAVWTPTSPERPTASFAFGCADGRVFVYHQAHETGSYHLNCSISAHDDRIEALAFDVNHRRVASAGNGTAKVWQLDSEGHLKLLHALLPEPFVIRSVEFLDRGSSLLICYLESHQVVSQKIEPWSKEWSHQLSTRIGHAAIGGDGRTLIISNLVDGVDTYAIPPREPLRTFRHPISQNVPLFVSAVSGSSLFVVGSDDGCPRLYDQRTGHLSDVLCHGKSLVQVVDAVSGDDNFVIATGSSDAEEGQIKIWTPLKEDIPKLSSSPQLAPQGGISFGQMFLMVVICVVVQALIIYIPKDKVAELINKVPRPNLA